MEKIQVPSQKKLHGSLVLREILFLPSSTGVTVTLEQQQQKKFCKMLTFEL